MIELKLAGRTIKTERKAFVMGILNATPDSFYEDSRGGIERAVKMIEDGADIIDVGAESTRPGSSYIDAEEEMKRLIPVIKEIRKISDIPVSVDTRKKIVMERAFDSGADILNDISALEDDSEMVNFASQKKIPVILMHRNAICKRPFEEVNEYLLKRASFAEKNGISSEKIIVDPGIGFNKNLEDNVDLIKNCGKLADGKYKILMALSRKRCMGEITGRSVEESLPATLEANLISVIKGVSLVRVHDVKETIDTLEILRYTY